MRRFDFPRKLGVCERLFGTSIARHGVCWVETAAHRNWKLDLQNPTHRWIVYGDYEGGPFIKWARMNLPPTGVVVDSGANIGQMLLYLAQYVPLGCVLAFEPSSESADWLQECLAANPELRVEMLRLGLGDAEQRGFIRSIGPAQVHGAWNQISETEGEPIKLARLDDVLRDRAIGQVDLWKLDVEGYELQALQGAESLLSRHAVRALYVELAFGHGAQIVDYLGVFDYECHLFDRQGQLYRPQSLPPHTNGLFLPRQASPAH